jgi:hypothetical protein
MTTPPQELVERGGKALAMLYVTYPLVGGMDAVA